MDCFFELLLRMGLDSQRPIVLYHPNFNDVFQSIFISNPQLIAQPFRQSLWQGDIAALDVIKRQYLPRRCITGSVKLEAELKDKTKVTLFVFTSTSSHRLKQEPTTIGLFARVSPSGYPWRVKATGVPTPKY